jgi:hypothetical protein
MWQLQWMLNLIPDSIVVGVTYLLFAAGVVLYVASKLVKWIPMSGSYILVVELAGVALLIVAAYFAGGHDTRAAWQARVKDLEQQVAAAEAKSKEINTVIQYQYRDKVRTVKETQVVVQERIVKEVAKMDAECRVSPEAIDILNQAAGGKK